MAASRVRCRAVWGLAACLLSVTRPVAGDSFTLYLLQSSSTCLAVSNQARSHSQDKCSNGFVLARLDDVTQLEELGTVLTSGVRYHVAVSLQTGGYEWSDGQPVDDALWTSGAPPSGGQCGAVQRSGSGSGSTRLTGVGCATSEKYVCRSTSHSCSGATIITPLPTAIKTSTAVTTLHADTTASQSEVETTSQSEVETTSQSEVETTSQSEAKTMSQQEVETTSQSEVETTSQPKVKTTSQPEVETKSQSEVETTSQPKVETTSQPEVEATSQPEVQTTSQPKVKTTSQPEVKTTSQSEVETTSQSEVETTSQSEVETTSQSEVETTPQLEVETTSQPEVETTSQPEVETTSQPKVETTSQSEVKTTSQSAVKTTSQSAVKTTPQSGDTAPPLTSRAQYRACRCQRAVPTNATARASREQEAEDSAERVRLDLTLVKRNLSSAVRTKTSARDDRGSARAAGGLSIACLVLVFGSIFLLDLSRLAPLLASLTARVDSSTDTTQSSPEVKSGSQVRESGQGVTSDE